MLVEIARCSLASSLLQNGDSALIRAARNGRHEVIDEFRAFNERIRSDDGDVDVDDSGDGDGDNDFETKLSGRAPIDVNSLNVRIVVSSLSFSL